MRAHASDCSGGQFIRHTEEQRWPQVKLFSVAFPKDKITIEVKHEVINRSLDKLMMPLSFDRSDGQLCGLLTTLIEDEAKFRQTA